jgi:glyoxylase-like metal-dependent hydrolase (beta-lactamase superfamily II)
MRKIKNKVYVESKFTGFHLGMVNTKEGLLLIDCPLKVDEAKEWISLVSDYGKPRYLAVLDAHPDRVLGTRALDLPIVAQNRTLESIREWADTFKGNLHPIGAESDRLKRITGVQRAAPEVVFSEQMTIHLGEIEFRFLHRPGPQDGSTWVHLPREKVVFIGDTVALDEPPYIGKADLQKWIESLDELRGPALAGHVLLCSQGGPVEREDINAMARFLRKVEHRLQKLGDVNAGEHEISPIASELLNDFETQSSRIEQALKRLQVGLLDLNAAS